MNLFLRGLIFGISIAAPVGPIGILCIRRTLANGRWTGFFSGLGAATADGLYGAAAAFGLTTVSGFLIGQQYWLRLIGGGFLIYLGLRTLLSKPAKESARVEERGSGFLSAYLSTLLLTLTNPMTIISFTAVFAGLGLAEGVQSPANAGSLVGGVFTGSALWWLVLSSGVGLFRRQFSGQTLIWVNRIAGAIIILFGLAALISLVTT